MVIVIHNIFKSTLWLLPIILTGNPFDIINLITGHLCLIKEITNFVYIKSNLVHSDKLKIFLDTDPSLLCLHTVMVSC